MLASVVEAQSGVEVDSAPGDGANDAPGEPATVGVEPGSEAVGLVLEQPRSATDRRAAETTPPRISRG
jgi:hypothetical protein